jgi:hypothetical protein
MMRGEIAAAVVHPLTILEIPVVPRPDQGKGVETVPVHATGRADVEPAAVVTNPVEEVHLEAAEGIDDALEAVEIEFDEVVVGPLAFDCGSALEKSQA